MTRISRRQKKWLRRLGNALSLPYTGAVMASVRMSKEDWASNLAVFRRPSLARLRFVRTS
jgi:hypothetical protein